MNISKPGTVDARLDAINDYAEKLGHNPVKSDLTGEEYVMALLDQHRVILKHILADRTGVYFICGESGDKDKLGLPEKIMICPAYGLEGMAVYTKTKDYSGPQW